MHKPTLLIVDDEKHTREGLREVFEESFEVYTAATTQEALRLLQVEKMTLALIDLKLGGESGITLMDHIFEAGYSPTTIIMTAYGAVDLAVEAMKKGAYDFITKPINIERLEFLLKRALRDGLGEKKRHRSDSNEQKQSASKKSPKVSARVSLCSKAADTALPEMIGSSPAMISIFETLEQVAPSKVTILLQGESGTGKEVTAKAIHALSPRAKKPFIAVHCAALSPQLLESELFGHEKGAFTGASERRIGRFEEARGGTLFLDEIGEIDPSVQVKILRVLGEGTFERVGSNQTLKTDVRLIAATNRRLEEMVAKGTFREDLYFRLNVVPMTMPPLRARKEDIPLLAQALEKKMAQEHQKTSRPFSQEAMQRFLDYHWPGNVRELRTAIEHAIVLGRGKELTMADLPKSLREPHNFPLLAAPLQSDFSLEAPSRGYVNSSSASSLAYPPFLQKSADGLSSPRLISAQQYSEHLNQDILGEALKKTGGNRTKAAALLGISRRTFYRKLEQFQKK